MLIERRKRERREERREEELSFVGNHHTRAQSERATEWAWCMWW
jgi:hypothetical protein